MGAAAEIPGRPEVSDSGDSSFGNAHLECSDLEDSLLDYLKGG